MYFNMFAWDGVGLARNVGFVAVAVVIVYVTDQDWETVPHAIWRTLELILKKASIFLCIEPWRSDVLLDRWLDGSQKSYGMIQFH